MSPRALLGALIASTILTTACSHPAPKAAPAPAAPVGPNQLSEAEKRDGWVLLFDGTTLTGWHTYKHDPGITDGWGVVDGTITHVKSVDDLVSDNQYDSFDLDIEWKVSNGGNSGIFFWANEGTPKIYMNSPEYQLLDNVGAPDGKSPLTSAGSLYALYPAPPDAPKPPGEWNHTHIIVRGSHAQYFLNGIKTVDVNFDSKEMKDKIAASKFKDWDTFGKSRRGHIGLQDHPGNIWFRSIKIRESR